MARRSLISFIWATKMTRTIIQNTQYAIRQPSVEPMARPRRMAGNTHHERRTNGSAIILAVVLTSLLAIVGVVFLLSSRVNSIATSAISENKDLNLAVDTIVAQISETLSLDVPGVEPNGEYYDYPDANNAWLACLEPYSDAGTPRWRQISNVYGPAPQNMEAEIIRDYQPTVLAGNPADADGDGVGDSIWVEVPGKTSSKGKPIYAAIRIIDNGGMLNVNTGLIFDPNTSNGSSQMQINLMALSWRPFDNPPGAYVPGEEGDLLQARAPANPSDFAGYNRDVVWRYESPYGPNTPFDISDELEMRNRFVLDYYDSASRIENWGGEMLKYRIWTPVKTLAQLRGWASRVVSYESLDPNYAYRHIATIQNFDRIIDPKGDKMLNINQAYGPNDIDTLRNTIRNTLIAGGFAPAFADFSGAQITANLIDYRDEDDEVTVVYDDANNPHFGFEQPCIYISELAQNFYQPDANEPNIIERSFAIELYKPFPEDLPPGPNEWRLVIDSSPPIYFSWTGSTWFQVFLNDAYDRIKVDFNNFTFAAPIPFDGEIGVEPNVVLQWPSIPGATRYNIYMGTDQNDVFTADTNDVGIFQGNVPASQTTFDPPWLLIYDTTYYWRIEPIGPGIVTRGLVWRFRVSQIRPFYSSVVFDGDSVILLQRKVPGLGGDGYLTVDTAFVPSSDPNSGWLIPTEANEPNARFETHSFQRDISSNKPIRRLWDRDLGLIDLPTIGYRNNFNAYAATGNPIDDMPLQAHPENEVFTSIGDFGRLFYNYGTIVPEGVTEPELRIDLGLRGYQKLFQYLTVFDPVNYGHVAGETRIKGRININTAPWFVIAQLPWVSAGTPTLELAKAIVAYRDKLQISGGPDYYQGGASNSRQSGMGATYPVREDPGFASVGELLNVTQAVTLDMGWPVFQAPDPNYDIRRYGRNGFDLLTLPDLTPADGAINDYEQRDSIFSRISNLITVRSDVFTAYILVRIGRDGPQKRVIAILDRSKVPEYPVKVIAVHPVPDPR